MKLRLIKLVMLIGAFIVLVSFLLSCTSSRLSNSFTDRVIIGTTSQIRTLDPADAYEFFAGNILVHVTDRLYAYKSGSTELIPQLATSLPTISADGKEYRIPLRSGVKFHDGQDFNAAAMRFSLERFMTAGGAPAFLLKDAIASITDPSPTELVIRLKTALPFFPKLLAFTGAGAVSPHAYGQKNQLKPDQVVGTGPYRLQEYRPGNVLRLDPFPEYWGTRPRNRGIDIQFLSSAPNLLNAFKTRAVDIAFQTLSPYQINYLRQQAPNKGWQVISGKSSTILYMTLNVTQPPLQDVRVRQALAAAIDRGFLTDRVFQGQRAPLYSLVPTTIAESEPVFQEYYGNSNSPKAQQLLQEAGFSENNPAEIVIWYSPRYAGNGDLVASTLKASLERTVGKMLRIKTERVEPTTAYALIEKGVYPAFLFDWVPDILDADNFLKPFLSCERSVGNRCLEGSTSFQGSFYFNAMLNQWLTTQRQEQNPDRRRQLLHQIQMLTAQEVPFIPLWQNQEYAFVQPGITGVRVEPTQLLDFSPIVKTRT